MILVPGGLRLENEGVHEERGDGVGCGGAGRPAFAAGCGAGRAEVGVGHDGVWTESEFWEWWLPYPDPDVPDTHFHHFDFSPREHLVPTVDSYPTIEKNKEHAASVLVSEFVCIL